MVTGTRAQAADLSSARSTGARSSPGTAGAAAGSAAVLLGLAYGLCLVSGLRQAEHMASPDERGAVIACYYAVAYLGLGAPYLADGLGALAGKAGAFAGLTAIIAGLALWTAGYAASLRRSVREPEGDADVRWSPGDRNSVSR